MPSKVTVTKTVNWQFLIKMNLIIIFTVAKVIAVALMGGIAIKTTKNVFLATEKPSNNKSNYILIN